jgi:tRNA threonylcarbamoyladenosine biosynthesis protein TsaB
MTFGMAATRRTAGGILSSVIDVKEKTERMLILDTCGEGAGVALSSGETVLARESLPRGGGSAEIVSAVQRVLERASLALTGLDAIAVVSGPGSFTGVRVGMAAAKGFAEATGARMIVVSRLAVLRKAAGVTDGVVVLDAGRGECYALEPSGSEWLGSMEGLLANASDNGSELVAAEEKLAAKLREMAPDVRLRLHPLQVEDALLPLLRLYRESNETMVLQDANYLRRESDIYKKNLARGA